MRIAVCDDEKWMRDYLTEKIRALCPSEEIRLYASGEEMIREMERDGAEPDILFLDIQMPGMDGMESAKELRRKYQNMILIFVTALEEYVFEAFDVGAFHYLVKPFSEEKLQKVLYKAMEQCTTQKYGCARTMDTDIDNSQSNGRPQTAEKSLLVKTGSTRTRVLLSHIIYAEVFNRKIVLHTIDGDLEYYGKMSELAEWAGEDFFRTHRAYLVHFKYVIKYDASTIWLTGGTAILAKKQYAEFVRQYLQYIIREKGE